ncbi:MAG: hypothetical protein M3018_03390, partial [Actinomycetota bacterium]|nr:hypothetical protein [Actinomycetota bacterium]
MPGFLQKIVGAGNAEIAQINAVVPPAQYAAGQKQVTSDLTEIYSRLQQLLDRHLSGAALAAAFKSYPASVEKPARDYLAQSRAAGLK